MSAFTAQQVIDVYLKRWQLADMTNSFIRLLRPKQAIISKLIGEPASKGFDNQIKVGGSNESY